MALPWRRVCWRTAATRHGDAVVFAHSGRRAGKGGFRAEVGQDALQAAGVAARLDARCPTKGAQFGTAPVQSQQLFDHGHHAEGRVPGYFFFMCLLAAGCWRRARCKLYACFSSAQSPSSSRPSA